MSPDFRRILYKSVFLHSVVGLGACAILEVTAREVQNPKEPMPIVIQEISASVSSASSNGPELPNTPDESSIASQMSLSALPEVNRNEVLTSEDPEASEEPALRPSSPKKKKVRVSNLLPQIPRGSFSRSREKSASKIRAVNGSPVISTHESLKISASGSIPLTVPSAPKFKANLGVSAEYLNGLIRLISTHRFYPRASVLLEEQGQVRVKMVLDQSGALVESVLVASSGFSRLDQAALETLRKIGRFPIPVSFQGELSILVPIEYRLTP